MGPTVGQISWIQYSYKKGGTSTIPLSVILTPSFKTCEFAEGIRLGDLEKVCAMFEASPDLPGLTRETNG